MRFRVMRSLVQEGEFRADSPVEALALAKEKFERPFLHREVTYSVREVEDGLPTEGMAVESPRPMRERDR